MSKVVSMGDHISKFHELEKAKHAEYVKEIAAFFDAGISDDKLQALAIYLTQLPPEKAKVFADEFDDFRRENGITPLVDLAITDKESAYALGETIGKLDGGLQKVVIEGMASCWPSQEPPSGRGEPSPSHEGSESA